MFLSDSVALVVRGEITSTCNLNHVRADATHASAIGNDVGLRVGLDAMPVAGGEGGAIPAGGSKNLDEAETEGIDRRADPSERRR